MKNKILSLIWVLSSVAAFAQKTLPPSLQPYAAKLTYKVGKSMHQAGFDMPNLPEDVKGQKAQLRSSPLQLDSTKTFYEYSVVPPADSTPIFRTIYKYPFSDMKIEHEYQYENGAWLSLSRSTLISDAQQRVIEVFAEAFDPVKNAFVIDSRVEVFPHGNSSVLTDSFFVYGWDTLAMDWVTLFYTLNAYDAQDRLQQSITSFDYFGQPLLFKDVHTYDANGDNTLIESFALFDGAEIPTQKQELKYQDHLLTQSVGFVEDGLGGFMAQNKITYSYTSFQREEQVNTYEWSLDANDWVLTEGLTYSYDNAQRVSAKETLKFNQDGSEARDRITYDYIEDENLALVANYLWDGNAFLLSDRQYYYYSGEVSASPEPVSNPAKALGLSPNPTNGLVQLNLNAPATIQIYSTQGELVNSTNWQPNQPLQVENLPSGLYYITARSENERYVGRLVKE